MPTRSEAIKRFLLAKTQEDLAALYSIGMECQVNVGQDGGEKMQGDYMGRKWTGWTDGLTTWKPFRIPWNAATNPEYNDSEINYDLEQHAEGIGMTGWSWSLRESHWVGFDFDAITGHSDKHSKKLTPEQIQTLITSVSEIPWVTIRKSTGGRGLHLYVFLKVINVNTHTEHAALARAVLGKMSALTGCDFHATVDACGGNMWVWHRKLAKTEGEGLKLIKAGTILEEIPDNWRDHVSVVSKRTRKVESKLIPESDKTPFEVLISQRQYVALDETHKKLMNWLEENRCSWWWDQDNHMLVTHTAHLKDAHQALGFRGFFDTDTTHSSEYNCYAFPLSHGAWAIRRYTSGVQEHSSWDQDGAGWTRCYYNREPTLATACRAFGGLEDPNGGFIFREALIAKSAAQLLGVCINIGTPQNGRKTRLKQHKDGRLIAEIESDAHDNGGEMSGWLNKKGMWVKMFSSSNLQTPQDSENTQYDEIVRHVVSQTGEDSGWFIFSSENWRHEPVYHVKLALASMGMNSTDTNMILGSSVMKCWSLVNKPFQPEYPGNREWNKSAAQLRFRPSEDVENLKYPTWTSVLNHCGSGLDDAVRVNPWCLNSGITTGGEYLKSWVASLFQKPMLPLPYLFFWGPQDNGKSSFHEAISLLMTKGYQLAKAALTSDAGFNGELEGAILCVIEELNLNKDARAYDRIKEWVTAREILIHPKNQQPYQVANSSHWCQFANSHSYCPIFPGDSRITVCSVPELDITQKIPKVRLLAMLESEAPDFLAAILNMDLMDSNDRLGIPVLETSDKRIVQSMNESPIEMFIKEHCIDAPGRMLQFSEFYERLLEWLDPMDVNRHSKITVGRLLPPKYPKGRSRSDNQVYIGNICWRDTEFVDTAKGVYVLSDSTHIDLIDKAGAK